MNNSRSYQDLKVWQKSIDLVTEIYQETKPFPKEEIYGLTSQIRRAAVSIPCNIAEGQGRHYNKEFDRFLSISKGSLAELETLVIISKNLNYLDEKLNEELLDKCSEIGKMLHGLSNSLEKKLTSS